MPGDTKIVQIPDAEGSKDERFPVSASDVTKPLLISRDGVISSTVAFNADLEISKKSVSSFLRHFDTIKQSDLLVHLENAFNEILSRNSMESIKVRSIRNYYLLMFIQNILSLLNSGIPVNPIVKGGMETGTNISLQETQTVHNLTLLWSAGEITEEEYREDYELITLIARSYRHSIAEVM